MPDQPTTQAGHDELISYIDSTLYGAGLTPQELQAFRDYSRGQTRDAGAVDSARNKIAAYIKQSRPGASAGVDEFTRMYASTVNGNMNPGGSEYRTAIYNDLTGKQAAGDAPAAGPSHPDISAQMQAFIDHLTGPIDPNDPTAQVIQRNAVNAAQAYGGRAGLNARSTLGQGAAAGLYNRGMQQYDFQRQGLAQQGLSMMSNRDIQLGQLQQSYQQMQNGLAENKFNSQQNMAQGLFGTIGGIAGGIIGGYAGGPQGASAGLSAGSSLGGGFGGLLQQGVSGGGPKYTGSYGGGGGINPYTGR